VTAHALSVRGLSVDRGGVRALDDVDLHLDDGEVLGIVGPNGAGKSTLIQAIIGQLTPRAGTIEIHGRAGRPDPRLLAHVPQQGTPDPLFPAVVEEVVWMGRYPHTGALGRRRAADRDAVAAALEATGLTSVRTRSVTALSGGQQRRVVIARALAQEAGLVLLDEPFAGIDTPTERDLRRVVVGLAAAGRGVLLVDHDLGAVGRDCDRVILLRQRVRATGRPADVLVPRVVSAAYGLPPDLDGLPTDREAG
jgi:manganese transport system ATP-binding protein